jgi:hypothetical protein
MKNYVAYLYLALISIIFAIYHFYLIFISNYGALYLAQKNCLISSLIGVAVIFFSIFVQKNNEKGNVLPVLFIKYLTLFFMIIIVTQFSSIINEVIENGIGRGKRLIWSGLSIIFSLIIILQLFEIMRRIKKAR